MNPVFAFLIFLIALMNPPSLQAGEAPEVLSQYRWKNRILLHFSAEPESAATRKFAGRIAAEAAGVADRDLVLGYLTPSSGILDDISLSTSEVSDFYRWIAPERKSDRVILIGKDGTVKHRDSTEVDLKTIFEIIDAMPMRQQEMIRNKKSLAKKPERGIPGLPDLFLQTVTFLLKREHSLLRCPEQKGR